MASDLQHGVDCRIYVPCQYASQVRRILVQLQGYTEYPATGSWINDQGVPVFDQVCVFSVLTTDHTGIKETFDHLITFLKGKGESRVLVQYIPTSFVIH